MTQLSRTIKCILFKVDIVLITQIEEIGAEIGEPDCRLIKPYQFFGEDDMRHWPEVTNQDEMLIHSDSILTIVDPKPEIAKKYLELIA